MMLTDSFAAQSHGHFWEAGVADGEGGAHLETDNILYVDGHVKAKRVRKGDARLGQPAAGGHWDANGGLTGYTWINVEADLPRG